MPQYNYCHAKDRHHFPAELKTVNCIFLALKIVWTQVPSDISIRFNFFQFIGHESPAQMESQYLVLVTGPNVSVKAKMNNINKGKKNGKYMDSQEQS